MPENSEDWITTLAASQISGYHIERIRELVREGVIKARKFGPIWQISKQSLIEYLKSLEETQDRRRGPKPKKGLDNNIN
jgi:hypothetical protein